MEVKQLIIKLQELNNLLDISNKKLKEYRFNNKTNSARTEYFNINILNRRIRSLNQELHKKIYGNVLQITYKINDTIEHALLTNITKDEAVLIMQLYGKYKAANIKILEIKVTPDFIR